MKNFNVSDTNSELSNLAEALTTKNFEDGSGASDKRFRLSCDGGKYILVDRVTEGEFSRNEAENIVYNALSNVSEARKLHNYIKILVSIHKRGELVDSVIDARYRTFYVGIICGHLYHIGMLESSFTQNLYIIGLREIPDVFFADTYHSRRKVLLASFVNDLKVVMSTEKRIYQNPQDIISKMTSGEKYIRQHFSDTRTYISNKIKEAIIHLDKCEAEMIESARKEMGTSFISKLEDTIAADIVAYDLSLMGRKVGEDIIEREHARIREEVQATAITANATSNEAFQNELKKYFRKSYDKDIRSKAMDKFRSFKITEIQKIFDFSDHNRSI